MAAGIAEENGLVVVFGASDDLCEERGAVDDEIDCFDGGETIIAGAKVKINWCKNGYSWTYDTDIPHECFDVYENGEKYCRGIVFSIFDVRLPVTDVRPERHGCWKLSEKLETLNMTIYECSACGGRQLPSKAEKSEWINNPKYAYCSYCGAKMKIKK